MDQSTVKTTAIGITIAVILTIFVVVHYIQISKVPGSIVIPAGNTYLGPNAPGQNPAPTASVNPNVFTAPADTQWRDVTGNIYPYTFRAPVTLKLVTFPGDQYDIYAISWNNIDPGSAVLIGVDNLKANTARSQFIDQPKINYVRQWWKQFGGLKGVSSIDTFTNSHNLIGYRAKYFNSAGDTPTVDIFFEVPRHPEYVIHLANGILDTQIFDKIVDSVDWK